MIGQGTLQERERTHMDQVKITATCATSIYNRCSMYAALNCNFKWWVANTSADTSIAL